MIEERNMGWWNRKGMLSGALLVGCAWLLWTAAHWESGDTGNTTSASTSSRANKETPIKDPMAYLNQKAALMKQKSQARRLAAALEFTAAESQKIEEAIVRKLEARADLMAKLTLLHQLLGDAEVTEQQLQEAIDSVVNGRQMLMQEIEASDRELTAELSTRATARLLVTGILDNGLGMMAGPAGAKPKSMAPAQDQLTPPTSPFGTSTP